VELLPTKRLEPVNTKLQPRLDELDVGSFPERVIYHALVLVDRHRTGRIDDVPTRLGGRVTRVEGAQEKLFLQVSKELEISLRLKVVVFCEPESFATYRARPDGTHLVDLDAGVLGDDTRSTARRVQQYPIEPAHHLGELSPVITTHDDVLATESMHVGRQTLRPRLVRIVGKDDPGVLQEGRDVGRLATRSRRHVQHAFLGLRGEGDDGQKGGSRLEHVMTGQVFGRGTDRYARLEDLESDLAPFTDGFEVDPTVDQRLGQVSSTRTQGVGSDRYRTRSLVGFKERQGLVDDDDTK